MSKELNEDLSASPIDALQQIIEHHGKDILPLFAAAITIYAGAQSAFSDEKEKKDQLETVICR
jgi:hypothetical protein